MLTAIQKAAILRKVGFTVPESPPAMGASARSSRTQDVEWAKTINTLYAQYSIERATQSLRDSQNHTDGFEKLRQ